MKITQFIGLFLILSVLGFGFWQLIFRGGKPENGRNGAGAAGDSAPMW